MLKSKALQLSLIVFFSLIFTAICVWEFLREGFSLSKWDLLLLSGLVLLTVGIWLSMHVPGKMNDTLTRLSNRGVLDTTGEKLKQFRITLESRTIVWGCAAGLIVGIAILVAFLGAFGRDEFSWARISLTALEVFGGYIAGWYLGRMASYGRLGLLLKKGGIPVRLTPGHPDGVAGLKPIGNFYFFQAMVASIPAIYLGFWLIVMPFYPVESGYDRWKEPYLGLLPLALAFEILAFLVPIWFFHWEMQKQKSALQPEADSLGRNMMQLETELSELRNTQKYDLLKDHLSHMTKRYFDIENMPTWPVDIKTRRRFTRNNLLLFIPLINNLIGGKKGFLQALVKTLEEIIK